MSDFPHDPKRPFVVVKQYPGGRKEARQFATESEAHARALKTLRTTPRGGKVHLVCSGDPMRVIQQWDGGNCAGCGMDDEACFCDNSCNGCGDDKRVCGCAE